LLEWSEIPVRLYRDLTDTERLEIELEENTRRKDLTVHELAKNLRSLAETTAEVLKEEAESVSFTVNETELPSRNAEKHNSQAKIAERIGISQPTISRAIDHATTIEKYPELETLPTQKHVLMAGRVLKTIPQGEREELLRRVAEDDVEAQRIVCGLPPMPPEQPKREDAQGRWLAAIEKFDGVITGVEFSGGIEGVVKKFSATARSYYLNRITEIITDLEEWRDALQRAENGSENNEG
jgi:ParB-like chromosome segregation protein Spo0J